MPLNDAKVKNAKPRELPYRLSDARGMYLEIVPSGGKYWRLPYRFASKRKLLALGTYPDVSLNTARNRRDDARRLLADGVDPSAAKQAIKRATIAKEAGSFEVIAREWLAKQKQSWAEVIFGRVENLFERDVFPWIGTMLITSLSKRRRIQGRS